jgi:hypothetical protein
MFRAEGVSIDVRDDWMDIMCLRTPRSATMEARHIAAGQYEFGGKRHDWDNVAPQLVEIGERLTEFGVINTVVVVYPGVGERRYFARRLSSPAWASEIERALNWGKMDSEEGDRRKKRKASSVNGT